LTSIIRPISSMGIGQLAIIEMPKVTSAFCRRLA
jgi:hypothetical protein